jgi:hypothetical protein
MRERTLKPGTIGATSNPERSVVDDPFEREAIDVGSGRKTDLRRHH